MQGFCKNILDVADNLERALDSVPGNVLEAAKDGGAGVARGGGGDEAEGAVTCELVAKNLSSLHGGVAMSQKVCPPSRRGDVLRIGTKKVKMHFKKFPRPESLFLQPVLAEIFMRARLRNCLSALVGHCVPTLWSNSLL